MLEVKTPDSTYNLHHFLYLRSTFQGDILEVQSATFMKEIKINFYFTGH